MFIAPRSLEYRLNDGAFQSLEDILRIAVSARGRKLADEQSAELIAIQIAGRRFDLRLNHRALRLAPIAGLGL